MSEGFVERRFTTQDFAGGDGGGTRDEKARPGRVDFRKGALWLSRDVQPVLNDAWLVRDWIPRLGLSVIFGASGAGKSHLAADLACHVARAEAWHGNPVEPGLVVYVALEGHGSLSNRVAALARAFGDAPVWFIRAPFSLAEMAGHVDDLVETIREEAAARGLTIRWVIIDTLARAMAGMEENSAKDMGTAVAGLEAITAALDCAVTAVHHSGKDQARGERGSGSLRAAAEASIEVTSEGLGADKVITAAAGKVRDGEDGGTFTYRLAQVELGVDKWGRPVTSCTVEPLGEDETAARRAKAKVRKLTARQRDGLDALRDAAERHGRRTTNSPDYPSNRKIVAEDAWRDEFYRRAFGEDDKPHTRKVAFQRVRSDLTEAGLVKGYNGQFWTTGQAAQDGTNGTNVPPRAGEGGGTKRHTPL
jgi:hypothetical protein